MSAVNSCNFIGNLTRDPELRKTSGDVSVANFDLAVNSGYGDKKKTTFLSFVAWDKSAEFVSNYLEKGSAVAVNAEANLETWTKDEVKHSKIVFKVNDVRFVGAKKKAEGESTSKETPQNTEANNDEVPF